MDYNYRLSYIGNFRWQDFRSSNPHFTVGLQVRLDIITYDNNSQTHLHIHNYHTNCEAQTNNHVKQTLSCFLGEGRIVHEIFGQLQSSAQGDIRNKFIGSLDTLWVGYSSQAKLVYLLSSEVANITDCLSILAREYWHPIPLVDTKQLPLLIAIPLTWVNAR